MFTGFVAALALATAPSPAPAEAPALPATVSADPLGDLIDKARVAVDDLLQAAETNLKATLYHTGARGVGFRDSLGCHLAPMRTVAVDPNIIPRHSVLFIKQTVGLKLPDGSIHDGYWYASDVGGAIKGQRIDLFTGFGAASMKMLAALNLTTISAVKVGVFEGCPQNQSPMVVASNG